MIVENWCKSYWCEEVGDWCEKEKCWSTSCIAELHFLGICGDLFVISTLADSDDSL